jgi:aminoglycoside phosphotransferase (APT) family kinase protein
MSSFDRMHADEFEIPVALVRRLVEEQFPQWSNLPVRRVASSGTDNAIFRLGPDMLVRLPRIERVAPNIAHEWRWLPVLAPNLPVPVSTVLGRGKPGEGFAWDWTILSWLPGENPKAGALSNAPRLAADLAGLIQAFRRIDTTGAPRKTATLAMRDAQVRLDIDALKGRIEIDGALAVWKHALDLPPWGGAPVWLHGDIASGNLLLRDGRLAGLIDFSGCGVGDPCEDMQVAWNLLPADARSAFRKRLATDDATWLRARARALAQALVQLPYYWDTNPVLAANARHVIAEVTMDWRRG